MRPEPICQYVNMSSLQLFDLLLQEPPYYYYVPIPSNDDPAADVLSRLQLFDRVPPTGSGGNISSQFLLMMSQRWSPSCLMISPEKFPQDAFSLSLAQARSRILQSSSLSARSSLAAAPVHKRAILAFSATAAPFLPSVLGSCPNQVKAICLSG